jgi:hypothetical protein
MLWVRISIRARCTTLCDKERQWLVTGRWFSLGPSVSSTNKTDRHDITEILLKVALNTIKQTNISNNSNLSNLDLLGTAFVFGIDRCLIYTYFVYWDFLIQDSILFRVWFRQVALNIIINLLDNLWRTYFFSFFEFMLYSCFFLLETENKFNIIKLVTLVLSNITSVFKDFYKEIEIQKLYIYIYLKKDQISI